MGWPDEDESDMICDEKKQTGSVLVADGDNHLGNQFSAMIGVGYDVAVACNGEEALDLCLKGSFDIVFTALKMPGVDGLTLSLQVKATSLNTPVVLILDEHHENSMNRIKVGRIDCVMWKPLKSGEIQETVQYFVTNCVRVHAKSGPLIDEFWDLPLQCHVTAGGKTRDNSLNNRNDSNNWLLACEQDHRKKGDPERWTLNL